jgi:hypothetical protein
MRLIPARAHAHLKTANKPAAQAVLKLPTLKTPTNNQAAGKPTASTTLKVPTIKTPTNNTAVGKQKNMPNLEFESNSNPQVFNSYLKNTEAITTQRNIADKLDNAAQRGMPG